MGHGLLETYMAWQALGPNRAKELSNEMYRLAGRATRVVYPDEMLHGFSAAEEIQAMMQFKHIIDITRLVGWVMEVIHTHKIPARVVGESFENARKNLEAAWIIQYADSTKGLAADVQRVTKSELDKSAAKLGAAAVPYRNPGKAAVSRTGRKVRTDYKVARAEFQALIGPAGEYDPVWSYQRGLEALLQEHAQPRPAADPSSA